MLATQSNRSDTDKTKARLAFAQSQVAQSCARVRFLAHKQTRHTRTHTFLFVIDVNAMLWSDARAYVCFANF